MPARPILWFDLGSPYAYLAAERIGRVLPVPVEWRPISLGGLFKATGRSSWGLGEEREAGMAEIERRAAAYGLPPLRWPDPWPGHMLLAMRACVVAGHLGRGPEFALAAFREAFAAGVDLSGPEGVRAAAAGAGLDPAVVLALAASPPVKSELRANTEGAAARGVVGVPTVAVGGELFWGDDRLEEAAAALAG